MKPIEVKEKVQFESGPLTVGAVLVGVGGLLAFIGTISRACTCWARPSAGWPAGSSSPPT
jgi:hypothetical protein